MHIETNPYISTTELWLKSSDIWQTAVNNYMHNSSNLTLYATFSRIANLKVLVCPRVFLIITTTGKVNIKQID